jgi:hypothetical protein
VAERLAFGKVVDRAEDFMQLSVLLGLVEPELSGQQRNDLVLFAALQANRILKNNNAAFEKLREMVKEKRGLDDLVATVETNVPN